MEANHIYQFSLLNALMSGVCETGITASTLLSKKCNQGLGTFARMNGELVMLDGKIYQLQSHGEVEEVDGEKQIPFAMAANFQPQQQLDGFGFESKASVHDQLDNFDKSAKNLFMMYRIEGTFEYLKCRTVEGQQYKGQPLSELGKTQTVDDYHHIDGTIIGFRSPDNWQGISVAGDHMHFISIDRTKGGHVLEMKSGRGGMKMGMAAAHNVHIELPTSADFNAAALVTDSDAVKAVEG